MTVDLTSGQVVFHSKRQSPERDFDSLLAGLDTSRVRADEIFQREIAAHKDRDRLLEKKFREAMRRSEEEPEQEPPLRPWDLD